MHFQSDLCLKVICFLFLDKPLKRSFGFFCSKSYYSKAYQTAYTYYKKYATSKSGLKQLRNILFDILNHKKEKRKAKTFLYNKKIDTTILNLTKQDYPFEDYIINHNIDEFYIKLLKEVKPIINAILPMNEPIDLQVDNDALSAELVEITEFNDP